MPRASRSEKLAELNRLLRQWEEVRRWNKLVLYGPGEPLEPVPKQAAFHALGATKRHRALIAANQVGKTTTAANEIAMHLTGRYPSWWTGYRFGGPVKMWAAGVTAETTRDTVQTKLLGEPGQWGSGTIPQECIVGAPIMSRGIAMAVDFVEVRHESGGNSRLSFKSYERGREKWQSETLHAVWYDEEPPEDIYTEGQTRLNYYAGISLLTFTPLLGVTGVVKRYLNADPDDPLYGTVHMDLNDATFYDPEQRATIERQYPPHERVARARGLPVLGSGLVFPFLDNEIAVAPFPIPSHWRRITGLDVGIDHPTAAVWIAYDAASDTEYVFDCYRQRDALITTHADAIRERGTFTPIAWPHDALKRQGKSGESIAELYSKAGLRMMPFSARYDNDTGGAQPAEPAIMDLYQRIQTGRFKVFATCADWFEEKATYHRKDGVIVDRDDDLMSATRYAHMMLRFAEAPGGGYRPTEVVEYHPLDVD